MQADPENTELVDLRTQLLGAIDTLRAVVSHVRGVFCVVVDKWVTRAFKYVVVIVRRQIKVESVWL